MWEFIQHNIWNIITVSLSVMAIAVGLGQYLSARNRKKFSYEVTTDLLLFNPNQRVKDIKLLYKDNVVDNANLVVVKLINTGNVPITSGDFESEIKIIFPEKTRILSSEIQNANPKNLSEGVLINTEMDFVVSLSKTLYNPGDFITVSFLVTDYSSKPKIEVIGRITGIKEIEVLITSPNYLTLIISALLTGSLGFGLVSYYQGMNLIDILGRIAFIMVMGVLSAPLFLRIFKGVFNDLKNLE